MDDLQKNHIKTTKLILIRTPIIIYTRRNSICRVHIDSRNTIINALEVAAHILVVVEVVGIYLSP